MYHCLCFVTCLQVFSRGGWWEGHQGLTLTLNRVIWALDESDRLENIQFQKEQYPIISVLWIERHEAHNWNEQLGLAGVVNKLLGSPKMASSDTFLAAAGTEAGLRIGWGDHVRRYYSTTPQKSSSLVSLLLKHWEPEGCWALTHLDSGSGEKVVNKGSQEAYEWYESHSYHLRKSNMLTVLIIILNP